MNRITVGKYGRGHVETIGEAFAMAMELKGHVDIYILNGIYDEKLELTRGDVTIMGESAEHTVIAYGDYAKMLLEDGQPYGTMRTPTLKLCGDNIVMKNITVKNTAGNGRDFGQAVALYASGDRMQFYNCRRNVKQTVRQSLVRICIRLRRGSFIRTVILRAILILFSAVRRHILTSAKFFPDTISRKTTSGMRAA